MEIPLDPMNFRVLYFAKCLANHLINGCILLSKVITSSTWMLQRLDTLVMEIINVIRCHGSKLSCCF